MSPTTNPNKNTSRNFLPLNSMLFTSTPNLRSLPSNPTLVNLRDAADTSVTALPTGKKPSPSIWQRVLVKIKEVFGKEDGGRELQIGEPTDFKHHGTGGAQPLRTIGRRREGGSESGGRRRTER
jgi:hypothetical protein